MDDNTAAFIAGGVETYLSLLGTIDRFTKELQQVARAALASRLRNLSDALGSSFVAKMDHFESYHEDTAWVAIKNPCPSPLNWLYLGVIWELASDGTEDVNAIADFDAGNAPTRERLLRVANEMVPPPRFKVVHGGWNEVQMKSAFRADKIPELGARLTELLDEWCRLFREIGGVQNIRPR